MKKYLRFSTLILIILTLLLAALPASAGATRTEFTGLVFTEMTGSGKWWGVGNPASAWGFTVSQTRNEISYMVFETDDPRFDSYGVSEMNLIYHTDAEGNLIGARFLYKGINYQNPDYTVPKWECTSQGYLDAYFNFNLEGVCQGIGENNGLIAKYTVGNFNGSGYPISGYILETGAE